MSAENGIVDKVTTATQKLGLPSVLALGLVAFLGYLVYSYVKPTDNTTVLSNLVSTLQAHAEDSKAQAAAWTKVVEFLHLQCTRSSKTAAERDSCDSIYKRQ